MKRATKDRLYFETGPDNEPTLTVDPGEEFEVQTQMNAGPWIDGEPDARRVRERLTGGNPSSGCIRVRGAEPGGLLAVHLIAIELSHRGYTHYAGSTGALPSWFGPSRIGDVHRIVKISDGLVHWSDTLAIPARPMIGFLATAPARERYHNGWGGYWGGNFDVQEITTGATVYLPVLVPGALLHVGDMHAVQGDGEICGAGGIETEGVVRLRCELGARPRSYSFPRIEDATHLTAVGMAKPAEDAFRAALESLILWLEEDYALDRAEAFLLLGQVMEARCTQFVNPTFSYVAKIAKRFLPPRSGRPSP